MQAKAAKRSHSGRQRTFTPPSVEKVQAHLLRHEPRDPSKWLVWGPLLLLVVAFVLSMSSAVGSGLWMLPWMILVGVIVMMSVRLQRARALEQQVNRVQELSMLRNWQQSVRLAWRLLPQVVVTPALHGRIVAFMAHGLDMLKAYDQALVAYDFLIKRLPPDHPGTVPLRIQRVMALLANDQLTDADAALRSLRNVVDTLTHGVGTAAYSLANLLQLVRTNHFADAVTLADDLVDRLRPLGVEAGYGHALMALSYHQLAQRSQQVGDEPARLWWSRATLLLPVGELLLRFPELAPVADDEVSVQIALKSCMPEVSP